MLSDFPEAAAPAPPLSDFLRSRGVSLRPAARADLDFLRDLFADFRAPELLFIPWTPAQKRAFVEDQFRLQHVHFTKYYVAGDFWVVDQTPPLGTTQSIGRLYLDRSAQPWRIVDIGLSAATRGAGLGAALIAWIQSQAQAAGSGVALQVAENNPRAHALYLKMGFIHDGAPQAHHQPMIWRP
ncbi:MAG: GNAT family N-acetyltransferase [Pseudomonadota bacterium]